MNSYHSTPVKAVSYQPVQVLVETKKVSKFKIALYIILSLIGIIIAVQFLNAAKYPALVQVIDQNRIGVNPSGNSLDFGDLPRDKDAIRDVDLQNNSPYKIPTYVLVWKLGAIADFIKVDQNNFTVEPGHTAKLEFSIHIPNTAEYKYYSGKVFIFQIPKIW